MAKKVRFTRDYDLRKALRVIVAYKAGDEAVLIDAQADDAIAAGAAELLADKTPAKRKGADRGARTPR